MYTTPTWIVELTHGLSLPDVWGYAAGCHSYVVSKLSSDTAAIVVVSIALGRQVLRTDSFLAVYTYHDTATNRFKSCKARAIASES